MLLGFYEIVLGQDLPEQCKVLNPTPKCCYPLKPQIINPTATPVPTFQPFDWPIVKRSKRTTVCAYGVV